MAHYKLPAKSNEWCREKAVFVGYCTCVVAHHATMQASESVLRA